MTYSNCPTCNKKTFFSKLEFSEAHNIKSKNNDNYVWIYKTFKSKDKKILVHKWICKYCSKEEHRKSCIYYSSNKFKAKEKY